VDALDGLHVLLEVDDGMLPRLQPLGEEAGGLSSVRHNPIDHILPSSRTYGVRVRVGNGLVAGDAGDSLLSRRSSHLWGFDLCGFALVFADAGESFHCVSGVFLQKVSGMVLVLCLVLYNKVSNSKILFQQSRKPTARS
jgi:hypothetical protein